MDGFHCIVLTSYNEDSVYILQFVSCLIIPPVFLLPGVCSLQQHFQLTAAVAVAAVHWGRGRS